MTKLYTKTLQDELDWKLLDQLHGAVAQISSFCFEIKKFCVTTLFIVLTLMAKFTSDKLDHSLFVAGLMIPLCFWFLDATGYFYQVKLRGTMQAIRTRLASQNDQKLIVTTEVQIIEPSRVSASTYRRIVAAGFNHSMWLYILLVVINLSIWFLYSEGFIK
ncbi:hypothetical protein ACRN9F_17260 [Shewanella oncorhynchi]|uniref:hypothetical protein n=1 Tax=Shewanella oncorhynchi TaxID=2726434 RepID=UPI003D797989